MRPRRISSIASSTGANRAPVSLLGSALLVSAIAADPFCLRQWCHQALHVLADHVALDVDDAAPGRRVEVGPLQGLGYQRHLQPVLAEGGDRKADAIERDRPALH